MAFAGAACLHGPPAPNGQAAAQQTLRWQGGKAHLARTWILRLVRRGIHDRSPALIAAAFDLAVPPLALFAIGALLGAAVAATLTLLTGVAPAWVVVPWMLALVCVPLYVLVGFHAAGAPASAYLAMLHAPRYVLTMALRAHRILTFRADTWVRTERDARGADDGATPLTAVSD